jgi:type IV fimbrial biogenesis protein FimT
MKKQSGFTLMELMVTIAIISLLSALAVPNMISWKSNMQLNVAVRMVKSQIEGTRMSAIKTNMPARLDFIDGGETFDSVKWDMVADEFDAPEAHRLPPEIILENSDFTNDQLRFTSRGVPLNALGGTVTLRNVKTNLCRQIVVSSVGTSRITECP